MPNFSNHIQSDPPNFDEVEVSLFGPGIGECLVVHIGNNEWIIIDSCFDAKTKKSIPLTYLEELGINPSNAVKLFAISHWHSDHIRGASQIAEQCNSATICFSQALMTQEFLTLVDIFSGLDRIVLADKDTCATKEMATVIKTIRNRCKNNQTKSTPIPYLLVSNDQRIYNKINNGIVCEIWALSPSSESILNSLKEIANLIPPPDESLIRSVIPKPTQNHNSVVLNLKYNNYNILLGSDLEETKNPLTGWSCIVHSSNRPCEKSLLFKIPHHGSITGHSDDVWEKMIEKDAICIMTSKIGGKKDLPDQTDINRIKKFTQNLYSTSYLYQKNKNETQLLKKQ
ncbi:MBL fold metallo-hydrolase [Desulfobacterium sp. N47]|uniref:MBL fold metallo-hydrolase n=1 Tax=Desulfobacterium sp. N47 TaxID=3115210 RepID=UPI003F4A7DAF